MEKDLPGKVRFRGTALGKGFTAAWNSVIFDDGLSQGARLLYLHLSHYGWRDAPTPDQATIGGNLGVGDRAVRGYLAELAARGLVEVVRKGRGNANEYVVAAPDDRQSVSGQAGYDRKHSSARTGSTVPVHREGLEERTQRVLTHEEKIERAKVFVARFRADYSPDALVDELTKTPPYGHGLPVDEARALVEAA